MLSRIGAVLAAVVMFVLAIPAAANAAVPGTWQKCSSWTGMGGASSYFAWADGRTYSINTWSNYRYSTFTLVTSMYDSTGHFLWVVDRDTVPRGYSKQTLDSPVATGRGRVLSAALKIDTPLANDPNCTARDVV